MARHLTSIAAIIGMAALAAMSGCGTDPDPGSVPTAKPTVTVSTAAPTATGAGWGVEPLAGWDDELRAGWDDEKTFDGAPTPEQRVNREGYGPGSRYHGTPLTFGLESLEETIVTSDVIARVTLDTVDAVVETIQEPGAATAYSVALVYTFDVLEYLKGSGGDELVTIVVSEYAHPDAATARRYLDTRLSTRETRWDNRQAIVFMKHQHKYVPSTEQSGRHYMGYITYQDEDDYTVSSRSTRLWLPAAEGDSGVLTRDPGSRRFLLGPPSDRTTATASRSATDSNSATITLGGLRSKMSAIASETAAGDGSEEYRLCVRYKYFADRTARENAAQRGWPSHAWTTSSGLPAGTVLHVNEYGVGLYPDKYGRHWTGGRDAALFATEGFDPKPIRYAAEPPAPPDYILHKLRAVTTRPLPAGEYRYSIHGLSADRLVCNLLADADRRGSPVTVNVTAPAGVAAEAMFDPAEVDGGTSATSTAKLFVADDSPDTTAIGTIGWKAGTLSVELTPASSFAGHHLDFIAADGTLAHTAAVDDATRTGDTLSWAVADSPWEAGDKMMVRLYRVVSSTCTVAEGAMKPGACYQDPVFAGAP